MGNQQCCGDRVRPYDAPGTTLHITPPLSNPKSLINWTVALNKTPGLTTKILRDLTQQERPAPVKDSSGLVTVRPASASTSTQSRSIQPVSVSDNQQQQQPTPQQHHLAAHSSTPSFMSNLFNLDTSPPIEDITNYRIDCLSVHSITPVSSQNTVDANGKDTEDVVHIEITFACERLDQKELMTHRGILICTAGDYEVKKYRDDPMYKTLLISGKTAEENNMNRNGVNHANGLANGTTNGVHH